MRNGCPVCGSGETVAFLKRDDVPVHQHLLFDSRAAARNIQRGELHLLCCKKCGFIFNATHDASKLSYDSAYENTQSCSAEFDAYLDSLVAHLVREKNVVNARIVEIGCGKGNFLRKLVAPKAWNNTGWGFDTSLAGAATDLGGRLRLEKRYFSADLMPEPPDVVICRHVIEHVDDPVPFLQTIRAALDGSRPGRIFLETPCTRAILRDGIFRDFFYEHCSYWTAESLATAVETAGFHVREVRHVFGGQYLWLEAEPAAMHAKAPAAPDDVDLPELAIPSSALMTSRKGR
jgi:2-polyprenyl-3-methyl-5-hydroxy-6-metoxy-1,4-benzoquinol methylase